jgi:outer membrane protein OmpA-like peptidoglycan-associated protein
VKSAQQEQAGPAPFALPDKQQTAAAPKAAPTPPVAEEMTTALSVPFAAGVTDIEVGSQGAVKDLAKRMNTDKNLRVQLMAYATDPEKNTSKARRLALDRAIAIRNLLIDGGVERTRIEVRALGDQGEGGNLDRVDAVAVKR